ncbi:hypothetical protein AK830_g3319 [Neonectria ditissima]|uniref:Uncharacterized protein n=1 Tax=Neonectria ditissima TaxID=78410 RepID=A0A0P7BQF9_9HYPO|nr:hypothetical protein AK830_g3319 [Neonectria ditissima]
MGKLIVVFFDGLLPEARYSVHLKTKAIQQDSLKISCGSENIHRDYISDTLGQLNNDPEVVGISILLPLPPDLNLNQVASLIGHRKDVEGLNPDSKHNVFAASLCYYLKEVGLALMSPEFICHRADDVLSSAFARTMKSRGYSVTFISGSMADQESTIGRDDDRLEDVQLGLEEEHQAMIQSAKEQVKTWRAHTGDETAGKVTLFTDDEGYSKCESAPSGLCIDMRDLRRGKSPSKNPRFLDGLPIYVMAVKLAVHRADGNVRDRFAT